MVTRNDIAYLQKASDIEDYFRDFFLPTLKAVAQNVGKWATVCLDFASSSREEKCSYKCRKISLDSHQNQSRNWWN